MIHVYHRNFKIILLANDFTNVVLVNDLLTFRINFSTDALSDSTTYTSSTALLLIGITLVIHLWDIYLSNPHLYNICFVPPISLLSKTWCPAQRWPWYRYWAPSFAAHSLASACIQCMKLHNDLIYAVKVSMILRQQEPPKFHRPQAFDNLFLRFSSFDIFKPLQNQTLS